MKLLKAKNEPLKLILSVQKFPGIEIYLFVGFYLESDPCLVCNNPEVPFSPIKLSNLKVRKTGTLTFTINILRCIIQCTFTFCTVNRTVMYARNWCSALVNQVSLNNQGKTYFLVCFEQFALFHNFHMTINDPGPNWNGMNSNDTTSTEWKLIVCFVMVFVCLFVLNQMWILFRLILNTQLVTRWLNSLDLTVSARLRYG